MAYRQSLEMLVSIAQLWNIIGNTVVYAPYFPLLHSNATHQRSYRFRHRKDIRMTQFLQPTVVMFVLYRVVLNDDKRRCSTVHAGIFGKSLILYRLLVISKRKFQSIQHTLMQWHFRKMEHILGIVGNGIVCKQPTITNTGCVLHQCAHFTKDDTRGQHRHQYKTNRKR